MLRRTVLLLVSCLACGAAAAADPTTVEVDGVTLTLQLPDGWNSRIGSADPGPQFINEESKADIWLVPTPPGNLDKYKIPGLPPEEGLKMTLRFGFGRMIEQATSEKPEVLPMPGSDPPGFYVAFPMPGGNGRFSIIGAIYQNEVEVVMMGSAAEKSDVADVVAIMATLQVGSP